MTILIILAVAFFGFYSGYQIGNARIRKDENGTICSACINKYKVNDKHYCSKGIFGGNAELPQYDSCKHYVNDPN